MRILTILSLIVSIGAAAGCGKDQGKAEDKQAEVESRQDAAPAPDPAAAGEWTQPLGDEVGRMMKAMIVATDEVGSSCPELAKAAVAVVDDNRDLIARMKVAESSRPGIEWKKRNQELFEQFNQRLMTLAVCSEAEPELVKVLQTFSPPPR